MAAAPVDVVTDPVDLGALTSLVGYHLRRASSVFAVDFTRALEGTGMRQVPFGIMSVVGANPGSTRERSAAIWVSSARTWCRSSTNWSTGA